MRHRTTGQQARDPQDLARLLVARANAGDVEGMVALYQPDAVLAIGNGAVAAGAAAIRRFYADLLPTGITFHVGDQRQVLVQGDVALTSTRLPNGTVTAEVARRQGDGTSLRAIDQPSIGG